MGFIDIVSQKKLVDDYQSERSLVVENLIYNLRFFRKNGRNTIKSLNEVKLKKVLEAPLWALLEFGDKYEQPFISGSVFRHANEAKFDVASKGLGKILYSDHNIDIELDHVVPRNFLVEKLLSREIDAKKIESNLIACVLTRKEHSLLPRRPKDFTLADPWKYYRENNIEVFDRLEKRFLNLESNTNDSKFRNLVRR